ncbi:MAG: T9SS type A sorting domain-containing protein [Bacteroidia bacterium]
MKKIVALFLITSACYAQNQNSIWCFGDSAGINFQNINNPVPFSSGMVGRGSCTSISDTIGLLQFYSFTREGIGNFSAQIFTNQHQIMQNGDTVQGEAWYNELTIIPKPNSNNLYYLFSMSETNVPTQGMWYSLVDMNANGGLGSVIVKNVRMNNFRNADCVTAIKHGNGRDWWVFSKYSTNSTSFNRFYTYLVTPDTIMPPIVQNLNNAADGDVQRIIFNSKGTKMMQINPLGFMCEYDFDRCTAAITNPHLIFPEQTSNYNRLFWSGAYSPNDSLFYISTNRFFGIDTSYLFQFDLTAANIPLSCDTLYQFVQPVQAGTIRLAPDNKLYMTCFYDWGFPGFPYPDSVRNMYNENLSVVNYPDSLGAACDFQPFSFYLGGKRTYWGLPNNPDYNLGAVVGSPCDTLTTGIIPQTIKKNTIMIYPNPASTHATLKSTEPFGNNTKLILENVIGNKVSEYKVLANSTVYTFNTAYLVNGIYTCKLISGNEVLDTQRLVIIK